MRRAACSVSKLLTMSLAAVFVTAIMPARAAVLYTVIDVRSLAGPDDLLASRPGDDAIDSVGNVIGTGALVGGTTRPFYFKYNAGPVTNLGDLAGDFGLGTNGLCRAYSLNDDGWVVGMATDENNQNRPFLWHDDDGDGISDPGEMRELAMNPGATSGVARMINNAGQVVIGGNGSYLWNDLDGDKIVDADERTLLTTDTDSNAVYALTESGDVMWNEADVHRWMDDDNDGELDANEIAVIPASIFGGNRISGYDMNIHGQVCGYARNAANTSSRGFLWTDVNDNNIAELLEVVDLGHPITTNFFARALNDHGHVVGGLAFGSSRTAQIWDTVNGFRNLNDLIDPSLPYELRQAESINNAGQVTMYGRITGSTTEHVFILTPRVPPDQDFDGDVDADDFVAFDLCVSGATILVAPGCEASDFDQDGDADTTDFSLLQRCYSGENIPVDLTCDD